MKLTRSQKRAQKKQHQQEVRAGVLDISAEELQMLQKEDPSLANLKVGAGELQETHYYLSDGHPKTNCRGYPNARVKRAFTAQA